MRATEIRIGGAGGQGLILSTRILFQAFSLENKKAAQSQSYEPTSRGGFCHSDLVVSETKVEYPLVTGLDYLLLLDQIAVEPSLELIQDDALVLTDTRRVNNPPVGDFTTYNLPFSQKALELGNERVTNIIALGSLVGLSNICSRDVLEQALRNEIPKKLLRINHEAIQEGYKIADNLSADQPD